ncbi:carboxymuconolactone decarboxylase family protein [Kitasatospora cinereorecta]|uniref:Carboxymuconolactone decarboxylase family protein n=1 Tax=Kitasatospora cinereorecta TaxID=285560 RepID=A0ABW0VQG9_9ACTN
MNASTTPSAPTAPTAQQVRSRMSDPVALVPELEELSGSLYRATGNRSVPRTTIGLIQLRAGQIVGSTYLTALQSGLLRKAGESEERIGAVATWAGAPYFTEAERVALALVEAVLTVPPAGTERVTDELYARAAEHYDPKALATLTIAIGQVNFFVPLALIGKPVPGVKPAEQWT